MFYLECDFLKRALVIFFACTSVGSLVASDSDGSDDESQVAPAFIAAIAAGQFQEFRFDLAALERAVEDRDAAVARAIAREEAGQALARSAALAEMLFWRPGGAVRHQSGAVVAPRLSSINQALEALQVRLDRQPHAFARWRAFEEKESLPAALQAFKDSLQELLERFTSASAWENAKSSLGKLEEVHASVSHDCRAHYGDLYRELKNISSEAEALRLCFFREQRA